MWISTVAAMRHASAAWEDAGSNCTDQFSDALAVNVTGSVDRTTLGTYTITYDCTENSGSKILATWIDLSTLYGSTFCCTSLCALWQGPPQID